MARTSSRAALLALVAAFGCARGDGRKPVFAVEGRLTYSGEPMGKAMISFHPLGAPDAPRAQATADPDGRYRLTTYLKDDGAAAGEYAVTIYWPGKRAKGKAAEPGEDEDIPPDRLNRAHADPKTTKLRATVREQPNTIDFNLP